ncbi:glycoside hydrolase family 3 N-terminal domain-containing protein [Polaribacter huanghezhanensis]|uniref:glycoside hydrolase family 3 N-terminal domain-containing protein n=1 Tax=Polaribacter huanghezhanensis TaxID=1354726 RepID=UPI002648CD47|nr:glycoside hydrolase family 3 N-terminal domain-containing protein [Polaribacter huanghezhanensis]
MKNSLMLLFVFCFLGLQAQSKDPLQTKDKEAQEKWVDNILNNMTNEEKIGQLFMVQAYSTNDTLNEKLVEELIQKYHAGNLIFMQGTPEKQAELTNKYQTLSKYPLLIAIDAEWGLDMRLQNSFRYPWNMALGAIQDNSLIEQFGEQLGKHCKRLGIHINFAPVVDININPKNPIIGNRSFGENKYNVTDKAIAFTRGMQRFGVLANAKHFPGHGDTASDSHHTLPVINFDATRLDTLELYPYYKLFDENLASVMTAHLSIPKLEPNKKLPSSLSHKITTGLLKEKMGFKGLIITDGLNMKAAADFATSKEINLAAILAGNDVLLIPHEVPETMDYFLKAIQDKKLTIERLNESVRKILKAKYWAGLQNYKPIDLNNLNEDLNTKTDELLRRKLIENSVTVIKNEDDIIPIQDLEKQQIAYVKLGDDDHTPFVTMLNKYAKVAVVSADNTADLLSKLKPYNLVIIGYHISNDHPWKNFKFKKEDIAKIQQIAKAKKVILDVFASPYSLLDFTSFKNIEGLVVSYQNSNVAQEISAQQLFGAIKTNGKLPVSIHKKFKEGFGLYTTTLSRLKYGLPEEVKMSSIKLAEIDVLANEVIKKKMTPGMQILVARDGRVIYQKSFGYHTNDSLLKVQNFDIYDVASLTKILATLPMVIKAVGEGEFRIATKLRYLLPETKGTNKGTLTLKEILSHNARLKAWIPFYKLTQDSITHLKLPGFYSDKKSKKYSIEVAKNLFLISSYKDSIYKKIEEADQREKEGYKYSDLGFYMLKRTLEERYKKPLNILADENFYAPLGASRTSYLPLKKFPLNEIIPTEKDAYFRDQLLQGYVHDMGAAMLGGVGGHAGLFANANDVAKIMQMYLQNGYYGGKRYLKSATVKMFNKRYYEDKKIRRGLGFDKPQLDPDIEATCGCVSDESFGHSGFTGTYTWADPKSRIVYVFLSNRVYPTMENNGLITENIRTKIQQIIQDAILP